MMEPMDEFFRKKMDGRDLPFNEAHWVAAQQLLDDRDARRGAIWWWRSGLLAIALAVVVVALWPSTSKPGSTASATLSEKPVAEKKAVERSLSTDVSAEPDQAAGLEKLVDSAEAAAAGDKKEPVLSAASTGSVKPPQIAQPANSAPKPVERSVQAEAFKLENDIFKTLISPGKAPAAESTAPPVAMESQEEEQPERQMVAVFDPMPVLSFAVEGGSRRDVGELPDPCWPVRKRWSVQTILGGSLPAQGNQAGALLGLGASWPGRDGFGLYAEGLYRIRPLSGLPTQASLQRTYGFGLTENAFELRANSLHYVDVNAGATYALGRHQLHAGAGATYLFGARGQLEQAQKPEAELDYGPVSAISEGWIATEGLSQWLFRAQAGYTFEIFPNLQLAGRMQYSITPILTEMAPEQPRLSPVSFDLMLKYKLW
ncbi:hypothetical protein [Phaeodactylibacter xiamenensis]|uniref:hypothetical protein n=1 Tax=Phaeodactylibacter xiamenensis TaxID=1524460 RepID=UPI0024A955E8|nr:hypothetical protein [Phaeodactylibacter xiamenensis]